MADNLHTNRLAREQSPYLLQHAHNPVDWYPWCDEAFARARAENKPVFVSIGYATCHWCHVMEHESFEDDAVAAYLNEHFISIKVDREERPDVDAMCMDVCQTLTGHGGWPLTIVMDGERRPFFAGTYFPRHSFGNRLGFLDLLARLKEVWVLDNARVQETAREITSALTQQAAADFRGDVPASVMSTVVDHHRRMFDDVYGGFSSRPKFPSPHHLLLLLRRAHADNDKGLLSMVCTTLDAMRAGGMYDHVGFGFHRYSTDREWRVPHFEKMLYDQAMLMMAYTEGWQVTADDLYATVVDEIATYLEREMTDASGAFYSAQDADSEGEEGKFYVWSGDELQDMPMSLWHLLNASHEGNFHDEATGNPVSSNILFALRGDLREVLRSAEWEPYRQVLLDRRSTRIRPLTDDKVLSDWNGLMVAALARAGRAFGNERYTRMAERAFAAFVHPVGHHRYRHGHAAIAPMLDDYASMGLAASELYQTTAGSVYLDAACTYADQILVRFRGDDAALYTVAADVVDIPVRQKAGYDSAYPCGNSIAAMLFAQLGAITNAAAYRTAAADCVRTYGTQLEKFAPGFCMLLCAWDMIEAGSMEIAVNGSLATDPFIQQGMRHVNSAYNPRAVFVHRPTDEQGIARLAQAGYPFDTAPASSIMVCSNAACQLPITTLDELTAAFPRIP
jgi:uncharacterized protein YyaL (SSP411 family)